MELGYFFEMRKFLLRDFATDKQNCFFLTLDFSKNLPKIAVWDLFCLFNKTADGKKKALIICGYVSDLSKKKRSSPSLEQIKHNGLSP